MGDYMFGVTTERLSEEEVERRDRICKEEGGYGFVYAQMPDGLRGWFRGPNLGEPFDGDLRRRVLARVKNENR